MSKKNWCAHKEFLSNALHLPVKTVYVCPWCQLPASPSEACYCKSLKPGQSLAAIKKGKQFVCSKCEEPIIPRPEEKKKKLAKIIKDCYERQINYSVVLYDVSFGCIASAAMDAVMEVVNQVILDSESKDKISNWPVRDFAKELKEKLKELM